MIQISSAVLANDVMSTAAPDSSQHHFSVVLQTACKHAGHCMQTACMPEVFEQQNRKV
jgi:hypothetical protein